MKPVAKLATIVAMAATAALTVTAARPGVRISNTLTADKQARIIVATVKPRVNWQKPYHWRATLDDSTRVTFDDFGPGPALTFADTVVEAYSAPCPRYRVTVWDVVRRDSLTNVVTMCRAVTVAEKAFADSFPSGSLHAVLCEIQPPVGAPLSDSIRARNLTELIPNFTQQQGAYLVNRYTQQRRYVPIDSSPCASPR